MPRRALVLLALACPACGTSHVECDCASSGLQIYASGVKVDAIQASGPACSSYQLRCSGADSTYRPGCDAYYLMPAAGGECKVDVLLEGGDTRTKTFTFHQNTGDCCPGVYADGDSSWKL